MFEAEVKYRIEEARAAGVAEALALLGACDGAEERYADAYFDAPDGAFMRAGRELRAREIRDEVSGEVRGVLTFKDAPFDAATRSKPELEVSAGDVRALREILLGLGFVERVRVTKRCRNARVAFEGAEHCVTLARVEGLSGAFVEIERLCRSEEEARGALAGLCRLGERLGLGSGDLCPEYYTDLVEIGHVGGRRGAFSGNGPI